MSEYMLHEVLCYWVTFCAFMFAFERSHTCSLAIIRDIRVYFHNTLQLLFRLEQFFFLFGLFRLFTIQLICMIEIFLL